MAFANGELFIANADGIVAYRFHPGQTAIEARPRHVTSLPSGYNHHWTKSMVASPDGRFLFVGVGSNSNVGENGLEMEKGRAAIWMIDARTGDYRIFAGATDIPKGSNFHVMSNFIIDVQGDRATARSMFVFYRMEGNKPLAEVAGRYEDVLVRIGGVWKFLQRNALPPG